MKHLKEKLKALLTPSEKDYIPDMGPGRLSFDENNMSGQYEWTILNREGHKIGEGTGDCGITLRNEDDEAYISTLAFDMPVNIPLGSIFKQTFIIPSRKEYQKKFAIARIRTSFAVLGFPMDDYTDEQIAAGMFAAKVSITSQET